MWMWTGPPQTAATVARPRPYAQDMHPSPGRTAGHARWWAGGRGSPTAHLHLCSVGVRGASTVVVLLRLRVHRAHGLRVRDGSHSAFVFACRAALRQPANPSRRGWLPNASGVRWGCQRSRMDHAHTRAPDLASSDASVSALDCRFCSCATASVDTQGTLHTGPTTTETDLRHGQASVPLKGQSS
jgi:hypothetical protein